MPGRIHEYVCVFAVDVNVCAHKCKSDHLGEHLRVLIEDLPQVRPTTSPTLTSEPEGCPKASCPTRANSTHTHNQTVIRMGSSDRNGKLQLLNFINLQNSQIYKCME